jgi:hypothetical protein
MMPPQNDYIIVCTVASTHMKEYMYKEGVTGRTVPLLFEVGDNFTIVSNLQTSGV